MHSIVTTFREAVIKVEVANFGAAIDTLIDQDGGGGKGGGGSDGGLGGGDSLSPPRLNIFTVGNMGVMICLSQGGLRSLSVSS